MILEEVRGGTERFVSAYPYLNASGTWEKLFLHHRGEWNATQCAIMPLTCRLLTPELPTKPGVPPASVNNEEIVIFRSQPGASIKPHCGASNAMVNLHLTLAGGKGTFIRVGGEAVELRDGGTVCFQDSFAHAVDHREGGERISLVLRVMHPALTKAHYRGARRTGAADLEAWDEAAVLLKELSLLRAEYRRLAKEARGRLKAGDRRNCAAASDGASAGVGCPVTAQTPPTTKL